MKYWAPFQLIGDDVTLDFGHCTFYYRRTMYKKRLQLAKFLVLSWAIGNMGFD